MNIHEQFIEYGRNAKLWLTKCKLLLPEIARQEIWRKKGFGSIYEYAAKLAGMSRGMVDETLWILEKVEKMPEIMKVVEKKGLNSVRPIVSIVNSENAAFWAEKAEEMSKHTLQAFVQQVRPGTNLEVEILMHLSPALADRLEKLRGNMSWNEFIEKVFYALDQIKKPPSKITGSRHIPNPIQNYVKNKHARLCHFPNCKKRGEILHHTQRFALEKVHDPDRLVYLCEQHERLAHHGLIENEEKPAHMWKIKVYAEKSGWKYFIDQKVAKYRGG